MDDEQRRLLGFHSAVLLGRQLQKNLPDIVEEYRNVDAMQSYADISKAHEIADRYGVSERTALVAVGYAIRGYTRKSQKGPDSYPGLINDQSELEQICKEHLLKHGTKMRDESKGIHAYTSEERKIVSSDAGTKAHKLRRGVHALTYEQRRANGKLGGPITAKMLREQNRGLYALTREQRVENGKRSGPIGGIAAAKKRGQSLWNEPHPCMMSEERYALHLATLPEYKYIEGRNDGKYNLERMTQDINALYQHKRTAAAVGRFLRKKKRR